MSTEDFDAITATTLADYQRNAEGFREGTRGHDVSQNVEALLRHIDGPPPYRILDFGCGPGATWPPSAASATSRWDSKARRASSRWPGPTAVARYGNRISWRCDCRLGTSTASSPTPACSMCPAAPAAGARRTLRSAAAGRRAVQLQPARRQPRGLEWPTLRCLPRLPGLETPAGGSRFRRAGALLPAAGPAARAAALAGERLAAPV